MTRTSGIYPREPLHKKRANKGSSAPASFYYHKDIQYLLHEPLLVKFREHKAFAKKLSRALGRGEWDLAKNLEDAKPVARLDHLVKERSVRMFNDKNELIIKTRYPTFTLALQDLQDPLNLVHLFSTLPTNPIPGKTLVPHEIINESSRLISEWKLLAIKTHSLRKVFLGVKGVYYECELPGQGGDMVKVRWLEGYEFQQHVPHDVDFRILLTFVDLYRTLIGFVLYKLYTQENLLYPPPLDVEQDERGETVGAFRLIERKGDEGAGAVQVSKKQVKKAIRGIQNAEPGEDDADMVVDGPAEVEVDEEFVERPSKAAEKDDVAPAPLTTYISLLASSANTTDNLIFSPYTFYLSRETSSRTWEFVIRAMGGRVITSLLASSPDSAPSADSITHVVIDRPMTVERIREMQGARKWVWVQPQWIADCVNRRKVIGSGEYAPGQLLPPHLSPWDGEGEANRPWLENGTESAMQDAVDEEIAVEDEENEEEDGEDSEDEEMDLSSPTYPPALLASSLDPTDPTLLHAAELEAERNGTSHAGFRNQLREATKANASSSIPKRAPVKGAEEDLRKIMMSNKKAKLYEKMKYSNRTKAEEVSLSSLALSLIS